MTIRAHITDLREQRATYTRMLDALESGKLVSGDEESNAARMVDLRGKIADLDDLIEAAEAKHA